MPTERKASTVRSGRGKLNAAPSTAAPAPRSARAAGSEAAPWTFLTNHAHVLICLAADPAARIRDVADRVGITERAVQRIVRELEEAGYLAREKEGRRNHYEVTADLPLRHPVERHCRTAALLAMVLGDKGEA